MIRLEFVLYKMIYSPHLPIQREKSRRESTSRIRQLSRIVVDFQIPTGGSLKPVLIEACGERSQTVEGRSLGMAYSKACLCVPARRQVSRQCEEEQPSEIVTVRDRV